MILEPPEIKSDPVSTVLHLFSRAKIFLKAVEEYGRRRSFMPVSEHCVMSGKILWEKSQMLCIVRRYLGEGNGNPLQYSCLENPINRGAWWATVHGVAKSRDMTEHAHIRARGYLFCEYKAVSYNFFLVITFIL